MVEVVVHAAYLPDVLAAPRGERVDHVTLRLLAEVGRRLFPADLRDHLVERRVDVLVGSDDRPGLAWREVVRVRVLELAARRLVLLRNALELLVMGLVRVVEAGVVGLRGGREDGQRREYGLAGERSDGHGRSLPRARQLHRELQLRRDRALGVAVGVV